MTSSDEVVLRPAYGRPLSPIVERTSAFFDQHIDSISEYSASTVADSDWVAQRIAKFEQEHIEQSNQPTVYNLRIDKIVIDGAKSKSDIEIEKPMKAAVNQIISDFNMSSEKFMTAPTTHRFEKIKKTVSNRRVYVPTAVLLVILLSLTIFMVIKMKNNNQDPDDTITEATTTTTTIGNTENSTLTPTDPTTSSGSSSTGLTTKDPNSGTSTDSSSSSTTTTTTIPTTTEPWEDPPPELMSIPRDMWLTKGLNISGRYKQLLPMSKIIVTSTQSDACYDSETCIDFMVLRQMHAYPLLDDVRENFLIDASGVVYEGRGFSREGQTTGESLTSYNNKAVSVSFIVSESESTPPVGQQDALLSKVQQEAFCNFINQSIEDGALDANFVVFKHTSLLASYDDAEDDSLSLGDCGVSYGKTPKIVKRRDWKALELVAGDNSVLRRLIRGVKVVNAENECDSKESCTALVEALRQNSGEIEYNFIIAKNGLIFEGLNFDSASPLDTEGDELWILCLSKQTEACNSGLEELRKFAVEMRKLPTGFQTNDFVAKHEL